MGRWDQKPLLALNFWRPRADEVGMAQDRDRQTEGARGEAPAGPDHGPPSEAAPWAPPGANAPSGAECLGFAVRRAARGLSKRYDDALSAFDVNLSQLNLLSVMAQAGLRSLTEIAQRSTTDRTTLNRTLGNLERRGLIESTTGRDRRTRRFVLTPAGRELLAAATPAWQQVQDELVTAVGDTAFQRLHKDLAELLARLDAA